MKIDIKTFTELNTTELYALLQLRSEVFVVEQECIYQDIDGKDRKALHVMGYIDGEMAAYTRCFGPGDYFEYPSIGRVLVRERFRLKGLAHEIMTASVGTIEKRFDAAPIKLSAQTYLIPFYEKHGFQTTGEEYLEDGIPHIAMIRA